ncbi:MAG TPA: hypothetical protein VIL10_06490 [Marmoricola sp.]
MPTLRPKGRGEDYPGLEVSDDQVEFWTERGYVASSGSTKKTASKRTAAKKSSK